MEVLPIQTQDLLFKAVIVGDIKTGKTNLAHRWVQDEFIQTYLSTIGVEFCVKTIQIGTMPVKIQLWDTSGQERFRPINSAYFRGSNLIFLVYDITNRETFDTLSTYFIPQISQHAAESVCLCLVGNKLDLAESRQVQQEEAMALANQHGMQFFEVSSKSAQNLDEMFTSAISHAGDKLISGNTNQ
ncbi:hypothetical protein FGO68_gene5209 [Halteria grandinella]|uniref:GTP-binding protein n=1 Tax=Halteria grandinella TaxID=5974 RepID=A0A8J8NI32_HALGN|nr:hypothetical protein FGO68_gene5209 [Halteria grandinella]